MIKRKKETKSKVVHIRVAPSKLEVLKKAKITPAKFFRRSLDLFIEHWKMKGYSEGTVEISIALTTKIKIDALETERKVLSDSLEQIRERIQEAEKKHTLSVETYRNLKWLLENRDKKDVDIKELVNRFFLLPRKFFEMYWNPHRSENVYNPSEFLKALYPIRFEKKTVNEEEVAVKGKIIQSIIKMFYEHWSRIVENIESDFERDLNLKYNFDLEKRFEKMLKDNKRKITQCQNEYLESLTKKES